MDRIAQTRCRQLKQVHALHQRKHLSPKIAWAPAHATQSALCELYLLHREEDSIQDRKGEAAHETPCEGTIGNRAGKICLVIINRNLKGGRIERMSRNRYEEMPWFVYDREYCPDACAEAQAILEGGILR